MKVLFKYPTFLHLDFLFHLFYFFESPFRISKKFLQAQGAKEIYAYGETPLTTLDQIARECRIFSTDVVYDLGCGRGRGVFWLSSQIGCTAIGIEMIPTFMKKAEKIRKLCRCKRVFFRMEDIVKSDFSDATVIYLDGIFLEEEVWKKILTKFSLQKAGTKIITVSDPLPHPFKCVKQFEGVFPWGKTDLYLNVIQPVACRDRVPSEDIL